MAEKKDQWRNFSFVVYSKEEAESIALKPWYRGYYICHNMDCDENGEIKKEHWHMLMLGKTERTIEKIASVVKEVAPSSNGYVMPVRNREAAERYLIHLDDEDKHQYKAEEVVTVGKLTEYSKAITRKDDDEILAEILEKSSVGVKGMLSMAISNQDIDMIKYITRHAYLVKVIVDETKSEKELK